MSELDQSKADAAKATQKRPDEYHIYVRHEDAYFYLASDGCFIPKLSDARRFDTLSDACAALDELIGDRDLGRDEPGIVANAWRWATT